jgi:pantothenate synthetase
MSSRNERLAQKSRSGSHLQNTSRSKEKLQQTVFSAVSEWVQKTFQDNPFTLEYFTIADEETLCPVHEK